MAGTIPGAKTKGLTEADLVLDVALRLEQLLSKQDGFEVVLTRRVDTFVPLEERTAIANREGADLFLSIHANASTNSSARGVETYFLNLTANPDAEMVAARENAASSRSMNQLPDIVKAIALNNKIHESRDFASMIQSSLHSQLQKTRQQRQEPRRQAGALHGAPGCDDAERAGGDLVHHQQAGCGDAEDREVPAAHRRGTLRGRAPLSAVTQDRTGNR